MPPLYDRALFLTTLSRFAGELPSYYDIEIALTQLTRSVTDVLGLSGSGVTLAEEGQLRFVTAVSEATAELERVQEETQVGPCRDAFDSGQVVAVLDVRLEASRWPGFAAAAIRLDVAGVAGMPMHLADKLIGAVNLYDSEPRDWTEEDLAVARVLADVATSYVVNASKLRQQEQLSEQLQLALSSRIVIEQAKGIVAAHRGVSMDDAFRLMRQHARANNASLRTVAEAIVHVGLRV